MELRSLKNMKIKDISVCCSNFVVAGIIIRKQQPSLRIDKHEESALSFTIKDSFSDHTNVYIWGSYKYISNLNATLETGDIVDVINPNISLRRPDDYNERYNPSVTSSFYFTLNDNRSGIRLRENNDADVEQFLALLRIPTKSSFIFLEEIKKYTDQFLEKYVDLHVVVCAVGEKRKVTLKDGRNFETREISLMDESCPVLTLQIVDLAITNMAENWIPLKTVLFIADVQVKMNEIKRVPVVLATKRTIITVDPVTHYASQLRYQAELFYFHPWTSAQNIADSTTDLKAINTVMSCDAVYKKAVRMNETEQFSAAIYCLLGQFDINGTVPISISKCSECHKNAPFASGMCTNDQCPSVTAFDVPLQSYFSIRMRLIDLTGSLPSCHVTNATLIDILNCADKDFNMVTAKKNIQWKWPYILKQFIARAVVKQAVGKIPLVTIVSMELSNLTDYYNEAPFC